MSSRPEGRAAAGTADIVGSARGMVGGRMPDVGSATPLGSPGAPAPGRTRTTERSVSIWRRKWMPWSRLCEACVAVLLGAWKCLSRTYLGVHCSQPSEARRQHRCSGGGERRRHGEEETQRRNGTEERFLGGTGPELNLRANPVPCALGRSIWTFHEDSSYRGWVATEPIASSRRPQVLRKRTRDGARQARHCNGWKHPSRVMLCHRRYGMPGMRVGLHASL